MQISSAQSGSNPKQDLESKPTFNVVIAYEDFAAGKHAKETYDFLVHQLGKDYEFTNQMWKFDILGNAKMREMAVKDAEEADLIIISTHGTGELPTEAKSWIDQWVAHKGHAMALVNLVDRPSGAEGEVAPLKSYLQNVAKKAHIDFFSQPNEWPDREDEFSTRYTSDLAQRTSTMMASFIHHSHTTPTPRWGINE
ncbi:MAG: hypothetical protein JWQ71_3245 [Pedosphaera sp.]|nr:hypothetical protein [Pedosphaera sp.]